MDHICDATFNMIPTGVSNKKQIYLAVKYLVENFTTFKLHPAPEI